MLQLVIKSNNLAWIIHWLGLKCCLRLRMICFRWYATSRLHIKPKNGGHS